MASTKEYLDFILEQLSGLDEITYKAMMGEYIIYFRGKIKQFFDGDFGIVGSDSYLTGWFS